MDNSIKNVASKLNITSHQVSKVLELISNGATVPFIARYRKEITNGLDEEQIEKINEVYKYDLEVSKRKTAIIEIMNEADVLTDEIHKKILQAKTKSEVESIYEPFKIGKKTKASSAIELGLAPLALKIFNEKNISFNPWKEAEKFLSENVKTVEFAIDQSKLIIAQYISEDYDARKFIKESIVKYGEIQCKVKRSDKLFDKNEKFKNYYNSSEKISKIPNHRIMAMNRAESLKIINISLNYIDSKIKYELSEKYFNIKSTGKIIRDSLLDSLKRLIFPSVEREVKRELFERAEDSSIKLFAENLEHMLLAPAVQGKIVLAIDPAFISGCKTAVLSETGEVLNINLVNPNPPKKDILGSEKTINMLIDKFNVDIIVIGNGTSSRETERFIASLTKKRNDEIRFAIVSEIGASVYSASKNAISEFPNLSVEQRSAITIGRRFQDPLNELVKVHPSAIGVGQYQHDVNQKKLHSLLEFKTLKVVNKVGVDANTATEEIFSYIAGLNKKIAHNIVQYRNENGKFNSRVEFKKIKGLGPKSYEQSIGFIRIYSSKNILDKTDIHPESYRLANDIIDELNIDINNIDQFPFKNIDIKKIASKFSSNIYDVELIINSLKNPGKDIRNKKDGLTLKNDVLEFKDINEKMIMNGTVLNVTDFGAFIYIGIKESVLIHISNLSKKFISHPSDVVKAGQEIELEILSIDKEKKQIQGRLI